MCRAYLSPLSFVPHSLFWQYCWWCQVSSCFMMGIWWKDCDTDTFVMNNVQWRIFSWKATFKVKRWLHIVSKTIKTSCGYNIVLYLFDVLRWVYVYKCVTQTYSLLQDVLGRINMYMDVIIIADLHSPSTVYVTHGNLLFDLRDYS